MNLKILIATHKAYPMPNDPIYLPIHVGKEISDTALPYIGDNTGENISFKNQHYCELTALYWAWKNLDADYIGLAHYRRHFTLRRNLCFSSDKLSRVLNSTQVEPLFDRYQVILPKPRNYFIETNYTHFIHAHPEESMQKTKEILAEFHPSYLASFEHIMKQTKAHRFNMLIMRRDYFNDYCQWLFSILFELENRLDTSSYDAYNQRIFGFISERLIDVYLHANQITYKELPVLFTEREHWLKKGAAFFKRKFF